jgi:hypothetical protein
MLDVGLDVGAGKIQYTIFGLFAAADWTRNRVSWREAFDGDGDVAKYVQNSALGGVEEVNHGLKAVLGACVYQGDGFARLLANFDLTAAVNEDAEG